MIPTGRAPAHVALVEAYAKQQGLFRTDATPDQEFSAVLELDLTTVVPSLAGPRRPQDRVALGDVKATFGAAMEEWIAQRSGANNAVARFQDEGGGGTATIAQTATDVSDGAVVIAAITSCTNTSNPAVLVGAGLLARNALRRGLKTQAWVKTSFAPGSMVVTDYLAKAGLQEYLDALGFNLVGYGCTTCIGNSGPLPPDIAETVADQHLVVAAVLSGNRNFEGRIHPQVHANYLASPPLVVAYALTGRMDVDLATEPLGRGSDGSPVYLKDVWPSDDEINEVMARCVNDEMFKTRYADVFRGDDNWAKLTAGESGIRTLTRFPIEGLKTTMAGTIDFIQVEPFTSVGLSERLAHLAVEEAIAQSGIGSKGDFPGPLFLAVPPVETEWPQREELARAVGTAEFSYDDLLKASGSGIEPVRWLFNFRYSSRTWRADGSFTSRCSSAAPSSADNVPSTYWLIENSSSSAVMINHFSSQIALLKPSMSALQLPAPLPSGEGWGEGRN